MRRSTSFLLWSWTLALVLTLTTLVGGVTASSKPAPAGAAAGAFAANDGKLCVQKFNDLNGSGKFDQGEPFLAGWVFTIRDATGNLVATVTTGPNGTVCVDLPPGTYTVTETLQAGWAPTTSGGPTRTVVVTTGQIANVVFGNHETPTGRLCVQKFNDLDGDGKQGTSEPALNGWVFTIRDSNGNLLGTITTGDLAASCLDLPAGSYSVTETLQAGWLPTTPGGVTQTVTVAGAQTINVIFGNRPFKPTPSTLVYECFELTQSRLDPRAVARLVTKNFGNDTVVVRKSVRMCEPALKTTTKPPTGGCSPTAGPNCLAPQVFPNTELSLDLIDPSGARHTVMFQGTMAQMKLASGGAFFDTEMLQLALRSTQPLHLESSGGFHVDSFFDVFVDLDTHAASLGRFDSPAHVDSFFDIFTEISLDGSVREAALGGPDTAQRLMPSGPLHFMGDQQGAYMLNPAAPIPLLDASGKASGWTIAAGILTPAPKPTPNQVIDRVLECFLLDRGADPDDPYSLRTKNFGLDAVMVHRATKMCEGALKSRQTVIAAAVPQPAPIVWECFDIVSSKGIKPKTVYLTTRNFGLDQVTVLKPDSLCEEAAKIRLNAAGAPGQTIGQPTGRVLECFTIRAKTRNVPFFLRTQNFGLDTVRVGRGTLLCEPAVKQPLGTFVGK